MNRLFWSGIIVSLAVCVWGEPVQDPYAEMGGLIVKPAVGYVAVINCGTQFDTAEVHGFFFPKGKCMKIPYRIFDEQQPFDVATAEVRLRKSKATSAIFIGSDDKLPMSLTAIEAKWTFINYRHLTKDNPSKELLRLRMDKMFSRATMAILGAGSFMSFPKSAAKRVNSVADLDKLPGLSPAPFAMMSMATYIAELGMKFEQETTYEQACEEGWAPAPTNAVQKAIWDDVHKLPTTPIRILPPNQKKK